MKRILIFLLPIMILLFTSCKKQGEENTTTGPEETSTKVESLSISDYFPFKENIHMKYMGEGNEYSEFETYVEFLDKNVIQIKNRNPGTDSVSVYVNEDGVLKKVFFRGETYYRWDYTDMRQTSEIVLKEPIELGNSWTLEDGATRTITAVDENVDVPQGSYEALVVTTTGDDYTIRDYYAFGIGLIKTEFISDTEPNEIISSKLSVYEESSFDLNLRVFFPDFNNDRLVYVNRPLSLFTNASIMDIFETEIKTIPENSNLKPLASSNTVINSIKFNEETGVINVDFSSDFVKGMNAGAGLEGMILSGVANTFGYYYQTNRVNITLDNKQYESGHIILQEGEYLDANWEDILQHQ